MVKFMKRTSIILVAIIICAVSVFQISAASYIVSGGFTFAVYDDYAAISNYSGEESDIVIPANLWGSINVTEVDDYAFSENQVIKSVSFKDADQLTYLGYNAFLGCKNLESIEFSEKISAIGMGCFEDCVSLKEAEIIANLKRIPAQAFYGCTALESVELPETLTTIDRNAFTNCPSLTYIYIPNRVTSIATNAFNGSDNVVINCYYGSYAYEYAVANQIAYHIIDGFELGDVNHSGLLEIRDATAIQRHLADIEKFDDYNCKLADFNGDEKVDINDVTAIQKAIAGF